MRMQRRVWKIVQLFMAVVMGVGALVQIAAQDSPPSQSRPGTSPKSDQSKGTDRRPGTPPDDPSQDPSGEPIKIDTQLVQLDVTVVDQKNNPVFNLNLNKNDFAVYEDKVQQLINSVSREEVPLSF